MDQDLAPPPYVCTANIVWRWGVREGAGTVAVTGATGFIGLRLVEQLAAAGYDVRVLVRGAAPAFRQGVQVVRGDLAVSSMGECPKITSGGDGTEKSPPRARGGDEGCFLDQFIVIMEPLPVKLL